jgi:hypothetical protein
MILKDFLAMETDRWLLVADFGQTSAFRRITAGPVTRGMWFGMQPYCQASAPVSSVPA